MLKIEHFNNVITFHVCYKQTFIIIIIFFKSEWMLYTVGVFDLTVFPSTLFGEFLRPLPPPFFLPKFKSPVV